MAPKVWFVTGCSTGFGYELALEILRNGDKVIATARNVDKLEALKAAGAAVLQFDVTAPPAEIQKKIDEAHTVYGQVDYLINNAGYILSGVLEETTDEEIKAQFNTNVFGLLNTTRAVLPYFRKQRSGVIANVSSIGGWGGFASASAYCASKWAVSGLSESLHAELADFGIKVCCIEPGYFRSNLLTQSNRKEPGQGASRLVPDYEGTHADNAAKMLDTYNGNQPGDVKKGVKVMYDVLSQKNGKEIPLRLPLGSDGYEYIKKKCEDTLLLLEEWKDVTISTDHDDIKKG